MKQDRIIIALLGIIFAVNIVAMGLFIADTIHKDEPKPHYVTDKADFDGRCYVQTWVEVTPEDYIGLDVGDEFEVTK